jgi:plasmid stabilization system protein ParE
MDFGKEVVWSETAKDDLKQIFDYFASFSLQSAENVVFGIITKMNKSNFKVLNYPEVLI